MDMRFSGPAAADSLAKASYDPKKLAALHTGCALLVSLVLTILSFALNRGIDSTAGIANLGNRAILSTAQSVLTLAGNLALPFWEIGFLFAALSWAQGRSAGPRDLLEGFRRMGAVTRLYLLQLGLYMGVAFLCLQGASVIFSLTPFYETSMESVQTVVDAAIEQGATTLDAVIIEQLLPAIIPIYVIFLVLFAVVAIPLFYRFRMAQFSIMDDAPGARKAMAASARMMRGNAFSLFRLDLRFWWYFAAQLLIAGVAWLDALLPAIGVHLPVSEDVLFFAVYGLHLVLQLALAWSFAARVQTTYAHCYVAMKAAVPPPPQPPMPKNPWQQNTDQRP